MLGPYCRISSLLLHSATVHQGRTNKGCNNFQLYLYFHVLYIQLYYVNVTNKHLGRIAMPLAVQLMKLSNLTVSRFSPVKPQHTLLHPTFLLFILNILSVRGDFTCALLTL